MVALSKHLEYQMITDLFEIWYIHGLQYFGKKVITFLLSILISLKKNPIEAVIQFEWSKN